MLALSARTGRGTAIIARSERSLSALITVSAQCHRVPLRGVNEDLWHQRIARLGQFTAADTIWAPVRKFIEPPRST